MRIILLSKEYPPHIYGGAGVHVEYLSRELAKLDGGQHPVHMLCFGDQEEEVANLKVKGVHLPAEFSLQDLSPKNLLDTLLLNVLMAGSVKGAEVVHAHTWYSHLAGCLIKQIHGMPLVLTAHSLEPQRPWKEEQLGAAYLASGWLEKTAYENADGVIAVSQPMKTAVQDLYRVPGEKIRVIPNGIDAHLYQPKPNPAHLAIYKINPDKPYLLFVGRISRQKGILHLINTIKHLTSEIQVVLCAGAADTEEIGREMEEKIKEARAQSLNEIIWVRQWMPRDHLISLYSHASVFVCPSVYEPFGIINLESMACGTPVVASAVGGIPEVVVHGETGWLVSFTPRGTPDSQQWEPQDPEKFSRDLAAAVNKLVFSPEKLRTMGLKARQRVEERFSWVSIARQTLTFYQELVGRI